MAADKLKKLEARGRAAFLQRDISSATRYFMQALEKKNSPEYIKSTPPKRKREKPRSKSLLSLNNNINEEDQVWILKTNDKRNKKNEKQHGRKQKDDQESSVEMLDGIISDANTRYNIQEELQSRVPSVSPALSEYPGYEAIQRFPSYPMGYLRKASALILLNQWDEARQTYTTGLEHCSESSLLISALYNLNKTYKITSCAANLEMKQLSDLLNDNSPSPTMLPPLAVTARRKRFRLQGQRRLTKKIFPRAEIDAFSIPQIKTTSFRRTNSTSTVTHL